MTEPDYMQWLPRFLAHGVDYNDFVTTVSGVDSWQQWLPSWSRTADAHLARGEEAESHGTSQTAGDAYLRAALCYHFAKYLWLEDVGRHWSTSESCVSAHRKAMSILDPGLVRLEIAHEGGILAANLRIPGVARPAPAVILVPGMDSTKEEFKLWEDFFLARGLATISLDGPGQGESRRSTTMRPDFEGAVSALLDAVAGRSDIAVDRVGITGVGMGGYFATRAAAFEPRLRAAGVVGGAYRFERMPPLIRKKFMFNVGIDDDVEAAGFASAFNVEGILERIEMPYLVIHGGRDAVMPTSVARDVAAAVPRGEFVLYPDGSTACQSVNHILRPRLADWFVRTLDDEGVVTP